ncbi:hypothetical protein NHX12_033130 [Muraenolepis orangiensis]|uniref:Uncharacterized protein n=1 Tax=Muraenolepis orangiensis TaxID=630683 RepID=A0A9Q0E1W6_9TELE|nr:hypothetical protein NHX12_033130 [Muraenolepis orangiensis]
MHTRHQKAPESPFSSQSPDFLFLLFIIMFSHVLAKKQRIFPRRHLPPPPHLDAVVEKRSEKERTSFVALFCGKISHNKKKKKKANLSVYQPAGGLSLCGIHSPSEDDAHQAWRAAMGRGRTSSVLK